MKKKLLATLFVFAATTTVFAKTYATVDGVRITEKEVNEVLASAPNAPTIDQLPQDILEKVLKQIVERKLLSKYAVKQGIKGEKLYKEKLASIEESLASDLWMRMELGKVKVTPKEIQDFYNENIDKFSQPEQVRARHILVKEESEAKKIIETLKKQKSDKLEDKFIELAKEKSTGPSGQSGGDLGFFAKDRMVKPFADAAFALKTGEITTKPVNTQFGWHVILTVEKKKAETIPFETIADKLEEAAKAQKFKDQLDKKLGALVERAEVQYFTK